MAWTDPITYVSGAILTAAQMNVMQDNLLAGGPIYTTAAARDAAITAPFEGQQAYLTAPAAGTVTATGAIPAIPGGITTVYNGTAWVCTTPVGASSNTSGTTTATSFVGTTTLTGDATAISVTIPTGTTAMLFVNATANNSNAGQVVYASVVVSGATTLAAADNNGVLNNAGAASQNISMNKSYVLTGLTAGVNTFTLAYRVTANTGTYLNRALTVVGIA